MSHDHELTSETFLSWAHTIQYYKCVTRLSKKLSKKLDSYIFAIFVCTNYNTNIPLYILSPVNFCEVQDIVRIDNIYIRVYFFINETTKYPSLFNIFVMS